jgi:cysteine synthase B
MMETTLPSLSAGLRVADHAAELVGNTPLIRLRRVTAHLPAGVTVLVKAEWFNPSGSVKDRPALSIIRSAEAGGRLRPGRTLLDSTSGNMGIAYATLGRALGYPVHLTMPANASPERIAILRALGTRVTLTDALEGSDGAMLEARRMAAETPGYFYANQYDNDANWRAHLTSTGPEILAQTGGALTHFVAGLGTTGTLVGTGRALKAANPAIRVIGLQPDAGFHGIEGWKHLPTAIRPAIYDDRLADEQRVVSTEAAHHFTRRLAREEGLFVGLSSGAALAGALQVAETLRRGAVVTVFPDAGFKYVSDRMWSADGADPQDRQP